jgi:hypothetical protein
MVVVLFPRFRTPAWRPFRAFMFVAMGLSALFPVLHGVKTFGVAQMERQMGLSWLVTQGVLYILGAGIYAVSRFRFGCRKACQHFNRNTEANDVAGSNPRKVGTRLVRYLGQLSPDISCVGRDGCRRTLDRAVEGV